MNRNVGWITVGGSPHRRSVPPMPDMSWLGEPRSGRAADRYEVARRLVMERELRDLAVEHEHASGTKRSVLASEINHIHAAIALAGGGQ